MLKNNYCTLLEKFLKDLIVKKYILALLAVIIVSSTVEAASEIQISVEDGEIFSLKVITLAPGQDLPFSDYMLPEEKSLAQALEFSKTSAIMQTELVNLLTTTLTGIPAGWHEAYCVRAALTLDNQNLNEIALNVVRTAQRYYIDLFPEYISIKEELIAQNPELNEFFNS
jgi:hypothetical protein